MRNSIGGRIGRTGLAFATAIATLTALSGCPQSGVFFSGSSGLSESPGTGDVPVPSGPGEIAVSWDSNRESGVNSAGGGYRVYYSIGAITAGSPSVDVPYVSGANAPTSARITGVGAGTYTVRVVAYSATNPTGSTGAETTVTVH